jgi:lipoate-protein ligase A
MRAICPGLVEPASGLALDEALVRAPPEAPVLAVWRARPAVVLGRFQRADWEIDAAACAARGVRAWRRFTGGGTVYLDPGTLCVALAVPDGHELSRLAVPELYGPLLDGVARACRELGVHAVRDERTVRVGGRKVGGVAAHKGRLATLVHGTLLAEADLDALRACIAGPRGGSLDGLPRPAPSRPDAVANVERPVAAAKEALLGAFGARPGALHPTEAALVDELERTRYAQAAWHAGPWERVTPPLVRSLLGGRVAGASEEAGDH